MSKPTLKKRKIYLLICAEKSGMNNFREFFLYNEGVQLVAGYRGQLRLDAG